MSGNKDFFLGGYFTVWIKNYVPPDKDGSSTNMDKDLQCIQKSESSKLDDKLDLVAGQKMNESWVSGQ